MKNKIFVSFMMALTLGVSKSDAQTAAGANGPDYATNSVWRDFTDYEGKHYKIRDMKNGGLAVRLESGRIVMTGGKDVKMSHESK